MSSESNRDTDYDSKLREIRDTLLLEIEKTREIIVDDPFSEYTPAFSMVTESMVGAVNTIDFILMEKVK